MEQKENKCNTCLYFHQHYIREDGFERIAFKMTGSGHCGVPRLKLRRRESKACDCYQPKKEQE